MPGRRKLVAVLDDLRESLWVIPAVALTVALLAAQTLPHIEAKLPAPPWFETNAASARSLLGAIATATLTLTGLVFSITMLVLQLTSSQHSPRVMRRFLRDRTNQVVLALFISTFAYALLALRNIEEGEVASFSVWLGFVMAMASVGAFVHYIDHMAQSIRVSTIIQSIGDETRAAIERLFPDADDGSENTPAPLDAGGCRVSWQGRPGVVIDVDIEHVAMIARRAGVLVAVAPIVGDFLPKGAPAFEVSSQLEADDERELQQVILVGAERTMRQDAGFGLRQLVDVAGRALSPGVNDPATAVQALDQVHDILRVLVRRKVAAEVRRANDGRLTAILRRPSWEDFLALGIDEIRITGVGSIQIHRRLVAILDDLLDRAPESRRASIRRELVLLKAGGEHGFKLEADRFTANQGSLRGHGA